MDNLITRPLLSGTVQDIEEINYPVLVSPKLDGIRCLKINGQAVTRKFKPIPNRHTREILEKLLPEGIDGEILLANATKTFNDIQSEIMSFEGEPDFIFHAFDFVQNNLTEPFSVRIRNLESLLTNTINDSRIQLVKHRNILDSMQLMQFEKECVDLGYEGIMIRKPTGRYKCGRSTLNEGILLKLKRFFDAEAVVIGFQEKMTNSNTQEKDEFGLSKRSHKKVGMLSANTLGSLLVRQEVNSTIIEFNIGSGFNDELKKEIWDNQNKYLGKLVKYKYQEMGKDAPRFPVFLGFRHCDDL